MIEYTVEDFFSKQLEVESTRILLNEPAIFSTNVLKDYLCHLAKIELVKYLDYLKENCSTTISAADIKKHLEEKISSLSSEELEKIKDLAKELNSIFSKIE